jgi:CBS domain-containing protein
MTVIDHEHLFLFTPLPATKEAISPLTFLNDVLYTNNPEYIQGMREMLNDMWKGALDIAEITSIGAMRSPPVKVSALDPVSQVIDEILENNIGSILVVEDNQLVGIITEKDILDRVIQPQRDPDRTFVKEVMSKPVVTVNVETPLIEALQIMRHNGIRRLAVIKEGEPVGVLTERRTLEKVSLPR